MQKYSSCHGTKSLIQTYKWKFNNQRVFFKKNAYLLFGWYQEFFDHHAVPGIGASVQGVRPIRTEGAEAVVFTVNHSRVVDDDEMNKKKLMHATLKTGKMAKNINKSCS